MLIDAAARPPALPSMRMRAFDVGHEDPAPLARAAAIRSPREQDPAVRGHARQQTPAERLRDGLVLARFARRLDRAAGARR